MRRRDIIIVLGSAVLAPRIATAQSGCCRLVGVLMPNPKVFATLRLDAYLGEFGWQKDRDYRFVFRSSNGSNQALPALAADLVAQQVGVIIAAGDPAVIAAQHATRTIPIVGICDDMVGSGLVASMPRPGGNTTGISILASELDVKRLQLLHEMIPKVGRIGVLADPTTISTRPQLEIAARALGVGLCTVLADSRDGVGHALDEVVDSGAGAVNVLASPILDDERATIIERLNRARLPAIYQWPEPVEAGGLDGPRLAGVIRSAVQIVDKLLRGGRPADIPVEQPTRFELAVNLKTATAIGLTLPQSFRDRADEVVE
jgi:putative tryptophan/tyrosine transport system substrate-binding protein